VRKLSEEERKEERVLKDLDEFLVGEIAKTEAQVEALKTVRRMLRKRLRPVEEEPAEE